MNSLIDRKIDVNHADIINIYRNIGSNINLK